MKFTKQTKNADPRKCKRTIK